MVRYVKSIPEAIIRTCKIGDAAAQHHELCHQHFNRWTWILILKKVNLFKHVHHLHNCAPNRNTVVRPIVNTKNRQLPGITSFVSGVPTAVSFTLVSGIDITGSASIAARPDVIANPVLPKGDRTFSRNFNTAAYRAPAQGTLGTAAPTQLRGPGINNHDIVFFKKAPFLENLHLQFRGELYSAFNHTQFSAYDTAACFDAAGAQINTRLGEFTSVRRACVMQFALKLQF